MYKIVAVQVALVTCLIPLQTLAIPNPDTGPGCGLGKALWSNSMNQKNILPQAFMATTNVTGFQTFAISSGTSGCTNDGVLWTDKKVQEFFVTNSDNIAQDLARGGGEYLASLAALIGVSQEEYSSILSEARQLVQLSEGGNTLDHAMVSAPHMSAAEISFPGREDQFP